MATAEPRDELSCSICRGKCADPVTLPCGHNFCQGCIGAAWDSQGGSGAYSCPECRAEYPERPALPRNRTLGNIAARLLTIAPEPGESGTLCTYCVHSPVPAAKSCLHCEASLCDTHLLGHSQSEKHILTAPTRSFGERKCPQHDELLTYYCPQDSACVCAHCCQIGGHRGHRVELLSEASEKKKETLRKVLEKLSPEREETEGQIQRLQERRREGAEVAAGETERVIALFRGIREELEALEKRLLSDISRQKEKLSLPLTELIQQLEIKRDELSRKIRHIEGLCNMAAPLTVLQERESLAFCGAEGAGTGGREREGTQGADNGGREREDTEGADNGGREREDTEGAGTGGREREGTKGADNGGREREGTEGAGTEGREREGTKGADNGGRKREGTKGADNGGREREGTKGADNGGREKEDTEGADNEGREREGTKGADNGGRKREGTKGADNGGREREGTKGADNGGRKREGTKGADNGGREREGTKGGR
uniref:Uncharacterized protein n=1 Tax=Xenopus tropicalis TaxID=8364 RepID=A0A803JCB1_XENTR